MSVHRGNGEDLIPRQNLGQGLAPIKKGRTADLEHQTSFSRKEEGTASTAIIDKEKARDVSRGSREVSLPRVLAGYKGHRQGVKGVEGTARKSLSRNRQRSPNQWEPSAIFTLQPRERSKG